MNGVLIVDKPSGPTSHDVVARVRRAIGIPRIGHTGTLDPLATGVLPLLVGRATRLAQFLTGDDKEYVAGVRLGAATPTYDAEDRLVRDARGVPVLRPLDCRPDISEQTLRAALADFTGTYWQIPPAFSAKKVAGTRAYALARERKAPEIKPVEVTVRELELLRYEPGLVQLRLVCSSGFYVRVLAHDLGQRLGCGAHLESLRRTRAGEFAIAGAVPLATIEAESRAALARLIPLGDVLSRLPRVVVTDRGARRAAHGNALAADDLEPETDGVPAGDGTVRVLDGEGTLLAIGQRESGEPLHLVVVLV